MMTGPLDLGREGRYVELIGQAVETGRAVWLGVWGPTQEDVFIWVDKKTRMTFDRKLKDGDAVQDCNGKTFIVRAAPADLCGATFGLDGWGVQHCNLPRGHAGRHYTDFLVRG